MYPAKDGCWGNQIGGTAKISIVGLKEVLTIQKTGNRKMTLIIRIATYMINRKSSRPMLVILTIDGAPEIRQDVQNAANSQEEKHDDAQS